VEKEGEKEIDWLTEMEREDFTVRFYERFQAQEAHLNIAGFYNIFLFIIGHCAANILRYYHMGEPSSSIYN